MPDGTVSGMPASRRRAPVTDDAITTAGKHIDNAGPLAVACRRAALPFHTACALTEKESGGRNIYGHDRGGVNTIDGDMPVTAANFLDFLIRVLNGGTSNGVGPMQITYAGALKNGHREGGHFRIMADRGLLPWIPEDNMTYGCSVFASYLKGKDGSIRAAGAAYNGGGTPTAAALRYGRDLEAMDRTWRNRVGA